MKTRWTYAIVVAPDATVLHSIRDALTSLGCSCEESRRIVYDPQFSKLYRCESLCTEVKAGHRMQALTSMCMPLTVPATVRIDEVLRGRFSASVKRGIFIGRMTSHQKLLQCVEQLEDEDSTESLVAKWTRWRYCGGPIAHPAYSSEGETLWCHHILPVVRWATSLASHYHADPQVLAVAAYLHDVARLDGHDSDHHIRSASTATVILNALTEEPTFIQCVTTAIMQHRGSMPNQRRSLEGRLLAAADAAATIEHYESVFYSAYKKHCLSFEDGVRKAQNKLSRAWRRLLPEVKAELYGKYTCLVGDEKGRGKR